jgi:two-component system cell cycle sensor histidine kinase/response regulator CckA
MSSTSVSRLARSSLRISRVCAAITIAVGALVLVGWTFDVSLLMRLSPRFAPMVPNTAVAFMLIGIALWRLSSPDPSNRARVATAGCGLLVSSVGALTLIEYATGTSLGIDQLISKDPHGAAELTAPGRMAMATAVNLTLLGIVVILMTSRRAHRTAQALGLFVCGLSLLALAGQLYDVRALYAIGSFTGIAFHTVVLFLVASVGLLATDPAHGVTALLTSDTIGGLMLRRILPFAIGIPVALGWLEQSGRRAELYQSDFGVALLVVASIVFIGIVVVWEGAALARIDRERFDATREASQALGTLRKLSRAVEQSPTSVIITDTSGNIEYVNPRFTQVTGYSFSEVLGMNPRLLKSGELSPEVYGVLWETITAGREWRGEFHNRKKDGELFWEFASISPLLDEKGRITHFIAVKEDITERKRAEEALRKSEQRFSLAFHSSPIPTCISATGTDRILDVNEQLLRTFGYTRGEVVGKTSAELELWADRAERDRVVAAIRSTGAFPEGDARIRTRAGELRDVLGSAVQIELGDVSCVLTTFYDVTERRRAEAALRERERHFRSLIENAQDVITIIDEQGTIRFQSPAAERILGRPPGEFVGKSVFDFLHLEDAPGVQAAMRRIVESPGSHLTSLFRFRHANGSWRTMEGTGKLLPGEGAAQIVVNSRDVTESRAVEEQLRQSQKMEAVGVLAGGIAHDFNNLLTAIMGYAELAAGRLKPEDPSRAELSEIDKAAHRAANLTRQLLAFSRKQVLQPRVIDLNQVVSDTHKMLRRLIGEDIELVTSLKERLGSVSADTGQIEQVLLNLAVNSRDAMPKGGKLMIETSEVDLDESYSAFHFDIPPGRYVLLAVSDTGTGMDAKTLSHVFEPFFTTKEVGKGTGLGLSMVYGVVKQSGGHVTVYSEPGLGTTFKIYLPRVEELAEARGSPGRQPQAGGTETVLVVEDEEAVRRLSCRSLEAHGYKTLPASSAKEALLICEKHAGEIHLMLSDVVMPNVSGKELAQRAAALRPRMKVLFMSGYTDDAILHHGVLDAGTAFLQKPFTPRSLAQKVRDVLDAPARANA